MIETFLTSIVAFIVAIGVMVTVHEFGHYWVARRFGVKVLRFSVGFGRPLWRRVATADRTEFVIAAIPLGGYVKMLDEREAPVPPEDHHRAFNNQSVAARSAIVAAGPAINIALAVFAYWLMFMIGITGVVANIGGAEPGSPAEAAGFEDGDRIVAVDGRETPTWQEVRLRLLDLGLGDRVEPVSVTAERPDGAVRERWLDVSSISLRDADADPIQAIGFRRWLPATPAEIGGLVDGGVAEQAGLRPGDRVIRADGQSIDDWPAWVDHVRDRPEQRITVEIERNGEPLILEITPEAIEVDDGRTIGRIGAFGPPLGDAERERMFTTVRHGPVSALGEGFVRTWDITTLTVRLLGMLVTGQAALANISGPVTIAYYAGETARIGLAQFLGFIALISISIGILNLLPIPVLDGGHLLYYLIEAIKGSPVSERAQILGQQIGIVLIFALIALALYNDFLRLVP